MATIVPRSCFALLLWSLPGVYAITSDMQGALDKHNVYRCMHGVPLLTWDDAIATNAQAWATNGVYGHSASSARVVGGEQLGENLAWGYPELSGIGATQMWYKEIEFTSGPYGTADSMTDATPSNEFIGHYTQVVWSTSTKLGCGKGTATVGGNSGVYWVCQYGPAGNYQGEFSQNVLAPSVGLSACGGVAADLPSNFPSTGLASASFHLEPSMLASVAIADDCALSALHETLEVNCKIPGSTTITSECCSGIQNAINQGNQGEQPSPTEQQQIMQECQSFQQYVMQHMPNAQASSASPQGRDDALINALPSGLTCTEAIQGGGESACALQAKQGKLAVTCEIPEETTITSQCCSDIQGQIDNELAHPEHVSTRGSPAPASCSSFGEYQRQHMPHAVTNHQHANQQGFSMGLNVSAVIQSLPGGLSCTETINGGDMLSLYAKRTFISAISLAAGVGSKDVSDKASAMPYVLSGIVGFLAGGLVVAGASLRYSKKDRGSNQYILLSA